MEKNHCLLQNSKVKHLFLTKFNLRTKPLNVSFTYNKCDYFESKKSQVSEEEKILLEENHETHKQKAELLQHQLKNGEVHSGSNDQAHCNVCIEGEAGRGPQEVGSCLIKYVKERLGDRVKRLILWSDSCGGQNRNIKLTLMLKALLNDHPTLQQINLRFLESGHSFLPNDTDFGKIESALKLQQRLYTEEDYIRIMQGCKKNKPMCVHRMRKEDFLSSSNLEKMIINRKKASDGSMVSWLNTKEIILFFSVCICDQSQDFKQVWCRWSSFRGRAPVSCSSSVLYHAKSRSMMCGLFSLLG